MILFLKNILVYEYLRFINFKFHEEKCYKCRCIYTWSLYIYLWWIVVDVYLSWCGPCASMSGSFKKIKLELGDPLLNFMIVSFHEIWAALAVAGTNVDCCAFTFFFSCFHNLICNNLNHVYSLNYRIYLYLNCRITTPSPCSIIHNDNSNHILQLNTLVPSVYL